MKSLTMFDLINALLPKKLFELVMLHHSALAAFYIYHPWFIVSFSRKKQCGSTTNSCNQNCISKKTLQCMQHKRYIISKQMFGLLNVQGILWKNHR